jgi:hypothetical protein
MNKYEINETFPFSKLYLANPNGLQGGSYFSKIKIDSNSILLQMPKCTTKNGVHKTGKKIYTDLLFDKSDPKFENWIETLSDSIKNLIYEKKDKWFQDDLSFDDIEYAWQDILRSYKKTNFLLRCVVKKPKNISRDELIMVYDEDENNLSLDDIKENTNIIPLIQLNGLKFTSHNFSLEFTLKQVMILKNIATKPLIQINKTPTTNQVTPSEDLEKVEQIDQNIVDNSENIIENSINMIISEIEDPINNEIKDNIDDSVVDLEKKVDEVDEVDEKTTTTELVKQKNNNLDAETDLDIEKKLEKPELTLKNDNESSNTLEKNVVNGLNEINLEYSDIEDTMALKSPRAVYIELYNEAKRRAKESKKAAILAVLELKRIKNKYMLDEMESSDDEFELEETY